MGDVVILLLSERDKQTGETKRKRSRGGGVEEGEIERGLKKAERKRKGWWKKKKNRKEKKKSTLVMGV